MNKTQKYDGLLAQQCKMISNYMIIVIGTSGVKDTRPVEDEPGEVHPELGS